MVRICPVRGTMLFARTQRGLEVAQGVYAIEGWMVECGYMPCLQGPVPRRSLVSCLIVYVFGYIYIYDIYIYVFVFMFSRNFKEIDTGGLT